VVPSAGDVKIVGDEATSVGGSRHNWVAIRAVVVASALLLGGCAQHTSLSGAEPRSSIQLSAKERQRLRAGMRVYLECVQGVTDALGDSKMGGVARSAKRCGMDMVDDDSFTAVLTLPPEFLALSLDTHQKFDALAHEVAERRTKSTVLQQLGAILANCTACHAAYRLGP
jgi:hypothetical protein